jgi:hypothetical protein
MKTFKDLVKGDRIYTYQKMKISFYTVTDVEHREETSIDWTWDHKERKTVKRYVFIYYKNTQGREDTLSFSDDFDECETYNYGVNLFSNREAAIKHVTDLYNYRLEKLEKLRNKYDKERSYIEKYKECLKHLPD